MWKSWCLLLESLEAIMFFFLIYVLHYMLYFTHLAAHICNLYEWSLTIKQYERWKVIMIVAEMLNHGLKQWLGTWWKAGPTQRNSGANNEPEWLEGVEPGSTSSHTSRKCWQCRWGYLTGDSCPPETFWR